MTYDDQRGYVTPLEIAVQVSQTMAAVVAAIESGRSIRAFSDIECVAAFEGASHLRKAVVGELQKRHGQKPVDEVRKLCLPLVGKLYGVALVLSTSNNNRDALVLDRTSDKFETAKTGLRDVVAAITQSGKGSGAKGAKAEEGVEIPAEIAALAAKLAAACNQYEGAKRLAAQAVAEAFAFAAAKAK